jgi:hypothetical protein
MVLTTTPQPHAMARLELDITGPQRETPLENEELEKLRAGNPAARALPLLAAVAAKRKTQIHLPYLVSRTLAVRVEPLT